MAALSIEDDELSSIASDCAFKSDELLKFATHLLGSRLTAQAFLNKFNILAHTLEYQTRELIDHWINSAPGPHFTRSKKELQNALEHANKAGVILKFKAYLGGGQQKKRESTGTGRGEEEVKRPKQDIGTVISQLAPYFATAQLQCIQLAYELKVSGPAKALVTGDHFDGMDAFKMLDKWLESTPAANPGQILYNALIAIGRRDLADHFKQDLCG